MPGPCLLLPCLCWEVLLGPSYGCLRACKPLVCLLLPLLLLLRALTLHFTTPSAALQGRGRGAAAPPVRRAATLDVEAAKNLAQQMQAERAKAEQVGG